MKVWQIASYELLKYLRNGRAKAFFLIILLILFTSLWLGFREYRLTYQQYSDNHMLARINWESQTEKDPHDAAHDGTYAIKPLHPFAMLDMGIRPFVGQVIHLGAHERKQSSLKEIKVHSGLFRFGQLTPIFILLYIIPLLIIFFSYDSLTREKESQTLALLIAQGISPRKLVWGKWLALVIMVSSILVLFFLVTIIFYHYSPKMIHAGAFEWFALIMALMIYYIVFVNISLLISSQLKTSGTALSLNLACWMLITLIVPKLSTNLASYIHPFPTLQTFRDNINFDQKNGLNGHNFWNDAAQDFEKQVLAEYGVETVEELPVDYGGLLLAEGEKYESEVYSKHFNLLKTQYLRQRYMYRWSSAFSPFLPIRFFAMGLARADYDFEWYFGDEAEKYRVVFNTALNMNIAEHAKGVSHYKADSHLWASIPAFEYTWRPFDRILRHYAPECFIMLLWTTATFALLMIFVGKMKVGS